MIHSIDVRALRVQKIFMEHVRHLLVEMESAAPLTMKHATAVLMIVAHVLLSLAAAMGHATGLKIVPLAQTIVGHVLPSPPVAIGSVMVQRIVAHALETVVDRVHCPHALKGKIWTATETVYLLHLIAPLHFLEGCGLVQNVAALMEPFRAMACVAQ